MFLSFSAIRTFQQSTRLASTPAGIAERKFVPLTNIKPIKADNLFQHLESLKPEKYPGEEKLIRLHTHPSIKQTKKKAHLLNGQPIAKGVVLRTLVKKPRKPNSANRKCVLLRMSFGKEMTAYVPGEGHNLQVGHWNSQILLFFCYVPALSPSDCSFLISCLSSTISHIYNKMSLFFCCRNTMLYCARSADWETRPVLSSSVFEELTIYHTSLKNDRISWAFNWK